MNGQTLGSVWVKKAKEHVEPCLWFAPPPHPASIFCLSHREKSRQWKTHNSTNTHTQTTDAADVCRHPNTHLKIAHTSNFGASCSCADDAALLCLRPESVTSSQPAASSQANRRNCSSAWGSAHLTSSRGLRKSTAHVGHMASLSWGSDVVLLYLLLCLCIQFMNAA